MRILSVIAIASFSLFLLSERLVKAEFYQYKDKRGIQHFTDNLNEVPAEHRKNIKRTETVDEPYKVNSQPSPISPKLQNFSIQGSEPVPDLLDIKALNQEKKLLEKKYEQLSIKQEALSKEKKNARTLDEVNAYEKKISALNMEIGAYEKRRTEFEQKRKAFLQIQDK